MGPPSTAIQELPRAELSPRSSLEKTAMQDSEKAQNHNVKTSTEDLNGHNQGVSRIEALYIVFGKGWKIYLLYASIALIAYAASLANNTLYVYLPFATSNFGNHSTLGTITVVTTIISSVGRPFIAKIADLSSRPIAFLYALALYVLGLILLAASNSVNTVAAGQVILTFGQTGLDMITNILISDITDLQWRGMAAATVSSPYIVNAFISGYITDDISLSGWRWGYGMFCIIIPVTMAPSLFVLFWADIKAVKLGAVSLASPAFALDEATKKQEAKSFSRRAYDTFMYVDGFGLILLGFAWSLILLPFTLSASAVGGWSNPSMIAMEVVGIVLLVFFTAYEFRSAPYPLMPRRIANRTFLLCCGADVFYFLSFYLANTFYSSYVYVIRDWSTRNYTFFVNSANVCGCFFSLVAGLALRYTHRYKASQLGGIAVRLVGMGILYYATGDKATDAALVMAQLLVSGGTACQASVPHADLATVISLLSLFTGLGGAVGSAIAGAVWTSRMPDNLATRLAGLASDEEIENIYGSITSARFSTPEVRAAVIEAYDDTSKLPLYLPAVVLSVLPLVLTCFTPNFHLGTNHNVIESKEVILQDEVNEEEIKTKAEEVRRKAKQEAEAKGQP
ncbi:major facilitator superfamily domain-containing protein [Leucosporidium creatinivorum]|uniref:Major facilitator superfamily domain-containing protein n=1 Tax=Leucosporidium creatinivorum TaxID=106004 RepID=A0A1Y2ENG1_9BASI|nr:major facilitator superfamily domain-containing protein [Leucosporidium creatinivorum]